MKLRGSMTVEATLLLPFVITLSMLLMYLTVYVYDRTLLVQDVNVLSVVAEEASLWGKTSKQACENEYILMRKEHPFLSMNEVNLIYKDNGLSKEVGLSGQWDLPIASSFGRRMEYERKVTSKSPVMTMYTVERMLDMKRESDRE